MPEFRDKFLQCCCSQNDRCEELEGVVDQEAEEPAAVSHALDWSAYFHEELPGAEEDDKILRRVLLNLKWQEKLSKKTVGFYQILSRLVEMMSGDVIPHTRTVVW